MLYKKIIFCFLFLLPINSAASANLKIYSFETDKKFYLVTCFALITTVAASVFLLKKLLNHSSHNNDTNLTPTVDIKLNLLKKLAPYTEKEEHEWALNVFMQEAIRLNDNLTLSFLLTIQCADPNFIYEEQGLHGNDSLFCTLGCKDPYAHGRSLLAQACWLNQEESVKILLENGADPDDAKMQYKSKGIYGCDAHQYHYRNIHNVRNPLFIACHNNNFEIVQLLIDHNTKTHPFSVYTNLDLDNSLHRNASNYRKDFEDKREIPVSCIHLALFNKNHSIFNHLMEYTLRKNMPNTIIPTMNIKSINQCFKCDENIWQNPHHIEYGLSITQNTTYHERLIEQITSGGFIKK